MKKNLAKTAALLAVVMFMAFGTVGYAAESENVQQLATFGANSNTVEYDSYEEYLEQFSKSPNASKTMGELQAEYDAEIEKRKRIRWAVRFGKYIVIAAVVALVGRIRGGKKTKGEEFGDDISDYTDFT